MKKTLMTLVSMWSLFAFACPDIPEAINVGSENFAGVPINSTAKRLSLTLGKGHVLLNWEGTLKNGKWCLTSYKNEKSTKDCKLSVTKLKNDKGDVLVTVAVEKEAGKLAIYEGEGTDSARQNRLAVSYTFKVLPLKAKTDTNDKQEAIKAWLKEGKTQEELKRDYRLLHEVNTAYVERGETDEAGSIRVEKVEIPFVDYRGIPKQGPGADLKGNTYRTKKGTAGGCHGEIEKVN